MAEFDDRKRSKGRRNRWYDYFPEDPTNDPAEGAAIGWRQQRPETGARTVWSHQVASAACVGGGTQ